jgi:hypothetical protein
MDSTIMHHLVAADDPMIISSLVAVIAALGIYLAIRRWCRGINPPGEPLYQEIHGDWPYHYHHNKEPDDLEQ